MIAAGPRPAFQDPDPPILYVVDDDEAVRDSLHVLLAVQGFDARVFASASAALAAVADALPACLIVDLHMPEVGGLEFLRILAAAGVRLPCVMISGRIDRATRRDALAMGAHAVLEKPFADADLIEAIRRARLAVAGRGGAPAIRTIPNSPASPDNR